jgi:thioesterase domain-containing protein
VTDRIPLDQLTSDALDALYERLEAAEDSESQRQLATAREALASATTRAARGEAAIARVRALAERWRYTGDRKGTALPELLTALDSPPTPATAATQATDGPDPVDPVDQYRRLKIELEHWQTVIVPELRAQRDQAATALAEILNAFSPVSSHNGIRIGWTAAHPIHPDDYDRWNAALPKEQPHV